MTHQLEGSTGEIVGTLEELNIHAGANRFRVYPYAGPKSVTCNFKPDMLDLAKEAIGSEVVVRGLAKFRANSDWMHEIDVHDLEVCPKEDELPTFEQMRGILPYRPGDEASEDIIARLRDGWGQ